MLTPEGGLRDIEVLTDLVAAVHGHGMSRAISLLISNSLLRLTSEMASSLDAVLLVE